MNFKKITTDFVLIFVLTFVVSVLVSYLYSLIAHGQGLADWGTAIRMGLILGVVISWVQGREKDKKNSD